MTRAQLAILPVLEGRKAERRIVNLAARLREPGASIIEVDIMNLSTDGFMAQAVELDVGTHVWLKLPGLEPQNCRVVWHEDGKAGFEFATPLHRATIELLVMAGRKGPPKNHFGPRAVR